ncbi:MAG: helix-turn-helix transcriptional regulator [Clostridia bacterium]|nr:helix-turn-helix transcriptional regulator [Clostridia bacterium]
MMTKFPEILKELRKEKNLSRQELADLILVNTRTICYWELGQRECNLDQLIKLSKIFCVTTDYLLGLED